MITTVLHPLKTTTERISDMEENSSLEQLKAAKQHISSPEQLTGYLKVTSPGVWIVLAAVFSLIIGIAVWSFVGDIEITKPATAVVTDNKARIVTTDNETIADGTLIWIENRIYQYFKDTDDDADNLVEIETTLPDGNYEARIDFGKMHPIEFLFTGR